MSILRDFWCSLISSGCGGLFCTRNRLLLLRRRHVAGGHVGAAAEEMVLHVLREVVARLLVRQVEPVLVHQHRLVREPLPPRVFRHVLENALAELTRIGREIEPLGLAAELDAFDGARHCASIHERRACSTTRPVGRYRPDNATPSARNTPSSRPLAPTSSSGAPLGWKDS